MVERLGCNVIFLPQNARSSLVLLYVATGSDFKSIDTPNVNQESNSLVIKVEFCTLVGPAVIKIYFASLLIKKFSNFKNCIVCTIDIICVILRYHFI